MLIISHRGNVIGKDEKLENNPKHINSLLKINIQVEIDVWVKDGILGLGHDNLDHVIDYNFIQQDGLWCHAKNLDALYFMLNNNVKNFFWHQEDDFTLTSSGYIWTYPNKLITNKSIIVDLNKDWKTKKYNSYGICVDFLD